jgi:hypothetical protein
VLDTVVIVCIVGAGLCFVYACASLASDLHHRSKCDTAKARLAGLPRSPDRVAALTVFLLLLLIASMAAAVHDKVD